MNASSLLVDERFRRNLHSVAMADFFFDAALLPGGWADDVRVSVNGAGWITAVEPDARPRGAEHVAGVAVPGVPNAHSHAFQRALAGLAEFGSSRDSSFWTWRRRMYDFLARLDPDSVEAIAAQLFVELLEQGFTSVVEFHYLRNQPSGDAYDDPVETARRILAAAESTGMGVTLLPTLYRTSDFGRVPAAEAQRRFVSTVEELIGDIAVLSADVQTRGGRIGLALHSLRAVPPEALAVAVEAARAMDVEMPIHIHVAEQVREVEECFAWCGSAPITWLLDHAPVDERWCLVHATHATDAELERVAGVGASVVLCPTTEANLGDGLFPFTTYRDAGGVWAIGTDAHVGRSPAGELRMLEYGLRIERRRRNVAVGPHARSTGRFLLDRAWSGGAAASGRRVGRIAEFVRADIVVLDADDPVLVGRGADEVLDSWVFSGERTPVRHVMVSGRWVVRDGAHRARDEIARRYRRVARAHGAETPQPSMELDE